ncbi:MAG: EFR1 family ferrodoxin [Armatimonadota bacterium]
MDKENTAAVQSSSEKKYSTVFDSVHLHYFTGTGNTYRVSEWIASEAKNFGAQVSTQQICEQNKTIPILKKGALLGILGPTHGFTAPWLLIKFAIMLPFAFGVNAFVILTRGGTRIGKFHIPGVEGTGCYLIALILSLKGYRVRGVMGLDMPANWMSLHPSLKNEYVKSIISRAQIRTKNFAKRILNGKLFFGGYICLIIGILLYKISIGYLLFGRFIFSKLFFSDNKCTSCGLCAEFCPSKSILMMGIKIKKPYWKITCENCMRCISYCPETAVQAGHSWMILLFLSVSWLQGFALKNILKLQQNYSWLSILKSGVPQFLFNYLLFLIGLIITYAIFYLIIRWNLINNLFAYTTLTKIYKRYYEPETKINNLIDWERKK